MNFPFLSNTKNQKHRRRLLIVSPEFILALSTQGFNESLKVKEGIPTETKFVTGYFDPDREWFCIVIEHPSFDEIESGKLLPQQAVRFSVYREQA